LPDAPNQLEFEVVGAVVGAKEVVETLLGVGVVGVEPVAEEQQQPLGQTRVQMLGVVPSKVAWLPRKSTPRPKRLRVSVDVVSKVATSRSKRLEVIATTTL
jgi:hypothetical protein